MKVTRVPTNYALSRDQKRYIAKQKMKEEGKTQICKHSYISVKKGNFITQNKEPSYFAKHWREYMEA